MNQLELIQSKIYEIRGLRVMLDFDLAQMYGTETAQLKRAVRRNKKRFDGEDFMFEVTRDELSRCQIGTLNKSRGSNIEYLPSNGFLALAFFDSQIDCVSLLPGQLMIHHSNTKLIDPRGTSCSLTLFRRFRNGPFVRFDFQSFHANICDLGKLDY